MPFMKSTHTSLRFADTLHNEFLLHVCVTFIKQSVYNLYNLDLLSDMHRLINKRITIYLKDLFEN